MACDLSPDDCRRRHIASRLTGAEEDSGDYEARCPSCGHRGFRISQPRVRRLRHIWTCTGRKCPAGTLRVALLRLDIPAACLGVYDGDNAKVIPADVARALDQTVSDILATPGLKLQDVRLLLAEAQGRKVPSEYRAFVKFAKGIGMAQQQAYEAARRWVSRPPDSPSVPEGSGVDNQS